MNECDYDPDKDTDGIVAYMAAREMDLMNCATCPAQKYIAPHEGLHSQSRVKVRCAVLKALTTGIPELIEAEAAKVEAQYASAESRANLPTCNPLYAAKNLLKRIE